MDKILITGANGFLGFYLVDLFLKKGFEVIATGKGNCRLPFSGSKYSYETLDFTHRAMVDQALDRHKPSVVIHCGAISKPDECELHKEAAYLTNVTGTLYLMQAAQKIKAFFLFLSTDFVFDGGKGMYAETDKRDPVNYYGYTKMIAEDEVMKYPGKWSIVRTVLVYGKPYQNRDNIVTSTVKSLKKGEALRIFDDQVRTPTYVEDLAKALLTIVEHGHTGIYHISGMNVLTPYQIALAAADYLNLDGSMIERIKESDLQQPARRPLKTGFNISKAKEVLNYEPISFREGLEKTLN